MNRFPPKSSGPQPNAKSPLPQSSGQGRPADNQNSIAKWGTPSHLPPKPPPSEVPYDFDRMPRTSTVPSQAYTNNTSTLSKPAASKSGPLVAHQGIFWLWVTLHMSTHNVHRSASHGSWFMISSLRKDCFCKPWSSQMKLWGKNGGYD
ncbi:hypothetical protein CISG_03576 [Coccidioides immitis RMSCC 3703]|uniref:Uncharacterized protein n=1 Tax=Coccidioides immitis RMSCC 3703 TaxID=454286 RepID=A0A0J8QLW2_COCIT|nr:hypothetical protein CISG_03576 [Coccidioides immitis RMSCC 3703]